MLRKAGKLTAILMAGLMIASPLTEVVTFADELESIGDETVLTQDFSDDSSEEILMEDVSDDEEDITTEFGSGEDISEADDTDVSFGTGEDEIEADEEEPIADNTTGRVIRRASDSTALKKNQHIYFGQFYPDEEKYKYKDPTAGELPYWRVLDANKANDGEDGIFVMSESLWGNFDDKDVTKAGYVKFNKEKKEGQSKQNDWQLSDAQTWCKNFYDNVFSGKEQKAIKEFSKTKVDDPITHGQPGAEWMERDWGGSKLEKTDRVFFLSIQELNDYIEKAKETTKIPWRKGYYVGIEGEEYNKDASWWLRTPSTNDISAGIVFKDGNITSFDTYVSFAARPAFNLDKSKILFLSDINSEKETGPSGAGALKAVKESKNITGWKLTVKDNNVKFYATRIGKGKVKAGNSIRISYSGASTGKFRYVSGALCDSTGTEVKYYGRFLSALASTSKNGEMEVTIPKGLPDGTYKLLVFSEQHQDGKGTDFASEASEITIEVGDPKTDPEPVVVKQDITKATVTGIKNKTYNGKARTQKPTVTLGEKKLAAGSDYDIKYLGDRKSAGTQKFQIIGKNNYTGTLNKSFKISRAKNTLKVSLKKKKVNVKESDVASKSKTIKANKVIKVSKAIGKVTYKKLSSTSKKIKVSSSGKITVKKGLKKGTYKVKVQVKAKGNTNYHSKKKEVSFKIVVK